MKYICLGYFDEKKWETMSESEQQAFMGGCFAYDDLLRKNGHIVGGEALQSSRNTVTLRWMNGKVSITDGQDMYSTWTYTKIVPMREIEYRLHFADKDGNRVNPVTMGLPPDMPQEVRNFVTFKDLGDDKTELTVTEYDWPVGQMMEMSKMGMEQCLDKMAASFAKASDSAS